MYRDRQFHDDNRIEYNLHYSATKWSISDDTSDMTSLTLDMNSVNPEKIKNSKELKNKHYEDIFNSSKNNEKNIRLLDRLPSEFKLSNYSTCIYHGEINSLKGIMLKRWIPEYFSVQSNALITYQKQEPNHITLCITLRSVQTVQRVETKSKSSKNMFLIRYFNSSKICRPKLVVRYFKVAETNVDKLIELIKQFCEYARKSFPGDEGYISKKKAEKTINELYSKLVTNNLLSFISRLNNMTQNCDISFKRWAFFNMNSWRIEAVTKEANNVLSTELSEIKKSSKDELYFSRKQYGLIIIMSHINSLNKRCTFVNATYFIYALKKNVILTCFSHYKTTVNDVVVKSHEMVAEQSYSYKRDQHIRVLINILQNFLHTIFSDLYRNIIYCDTHKQLIRSIISSLIQANESKRLQSLSSIILTWKTNTFNLNRKENCLISIINSQRHWYLIHILRIWYSRYIDYRERSHLLAQKIERWYRLYTLNLLSRSFVKLINWTHLQQRNDIISFANSFKNENTKLLYQIKNIPKEKAALAILNLIQKIQHRNKYIALHTLKHTKITKVLKCKHFFQGSNLLFSFVNNYLRSVFNRFNIFRIQSRLLYLTKIPSSMIKSNNLYSFVLVLCRINCPNLKYAFTLLKSHCQVKSTLKYLLNFQYLLTLVNPLNRLIHRSLLKYFNEFKMIAQTIEKQIEHNSHYLLTQEYNILTNNNNTNTHNLDRKSSVTLSSLLGELLDLTNINVKSKKETSSAFEKSQMLTKPYPKNHT